METECQEKIHHPYRAILRAMSRRYTVRSVSVRFERRRRARASPSRLRLPSRTGRTDDGRHPFVQIIPLRSRAAIRRRFQRNLRQLLLDASRAARQRTLLLAHPPEPLLFSFLGSVERSVASLAFASPRASRVVSCRVDSCRLVSTRRLRASHTHVETTTTGRRQFKVIISIQINLQTNEDEPKTKTNTQSVERGGGAGVNPTFGVCLRLI